ncbi:aldehyde reductase [Paenibacillus sp. MWE-103]|uniref:Aldehyde reductase n=1 Tax=Paenibacillus artemisiicola TaxID=1172618 RepID=A0ABS3W8D4_9BACL|nr:aldehyde reductase [Paenibacillus artemisiicola]MBO7744533.1 aldehyde reductase [Paenibacillus artemisiicola]
MTSIQPAQTVLVTGGTGFVAGWCIAGLLKRGYAVRATLRSPAKADAVRQAVAEQADPGGRLSFVAADLTADAGWDEAAVGCDYVLHVASPLGYDHPKDPGALIVPARDGTLRVLRAAVKAGVRRVVMTSSCAAVTPSVYRRGDVVDETLWSDPNDPKLDPYRKSKTIAEQAAWRYMREHGGATTLATVLPGAVFGPLLGADGQGSVQVINRLLQGKVPAAPRLGFEIVDVRDLADLHLRAMTADAAAGERFIAVGEFQWMADVARELREGLGQAARGVPTRTMPDALVRFLAVFDPSLRALTPMLGRKYQRTSAKARRVLGWQPRPARETVLDCAKSLIANGLV